MKYGDIRVSIEVDAYDFMRMYDLVRNAVVKELGYSPLWGIMITGRTELEKQAASVNDEYNMEHGHNKGVSAELLELMSRHGV